MIVIDGSQGEGGGQVLRSALALSLATGRSFRIENIRAKRKRPGMRAQHLASVRAAADVGNAELEGATQGSDALTFRPRELRPGEYDIDVGTAGSAVLVLQTVLPPLLLADGRSRITVTGGTHNPHAPPFEFLARTLLPVLERTGPRFEATLQRHGFAPGGGGAIELVIEPAEALRALELLERGEIGRTRAHALLANLSLHIAERELKVVARKLGWAHKDLKVDVVGQARGPGNALSLVLECDHVTEIFTAYGQLGVRAETVAARAVTELMRYSGAGVPVGEHLADQLLLPLALGAGGVFRTLPLTLHARTQIDLIPRFLEVSVDLSTPWPGAVEVRVRTP